MLAPDMFHRLETRVELGYSDAEFATAFDYLGKFDFVKAVEDLSATLDHLKGMDAVKGQSKGATTQVAALGYCLGGALAHQAAAHCEVDAAVSYYGVYLEQQLHLEDRITCPTVLHFGGADDHVPKEAATARLLRELREREIGTRDRGRGCPFPPCPPISAAVIRSAGALRESPQSHRPVAASHGTDRP